MNFFEQQERARKNSQWIIVAFVAVTVLMVLVINAVVLFLVGLQQPLVYGDHVSQHAGSAFHWLSIDSLRQNVTLISITSAVTAGVVGLASLSKIVSLRSGGAKVAAELGGSYVAADTRDPLRRRLYNVVEEISIASGTPVPDIFVLDGEAGINAFAAGYGAADAAIAVTQGTLEKLNRAELQGVIAHEFSHIFNGDMRINIRMMGVIFGIMVIAMFGRRFLHASRYRRSSKNNNIGGIVAIGLALMVVGYLGLFFARWMKSALSRQREYLADASAVQFTRDPNGIAGALKKIAAYNHGSYLTADTEEVGHMLFGTGVRRMMFATHPPLEKRIERIEKRFNGKEIEELAKKLKRQEQREHLQAEAAKAEQQAPKENLKLGGLLALNDALEHIGKPDTDLIAAAAAFTQGLNEGLRHAAHSTEWSPEVLLYSLLDTDDQLREKQLLVVTQELGDISESKIRHLITANGLVDLDERLPLLELAFPSLKRRPKSDIEKLLATVDKMALVDQRIDSFEYLLSRLIKQYMFESHVPNLTRVHGNKKLSQCVDELTMVVGTLAAHGQNSTSSQGLQNAQHAFKAGMESVGIGHKNLSFHENWHQALDAALRKLDKLSAPEKAKVVKALATTVMEDKKMITAEQEMMRVICALIHVPLPFLQTAH